MHTDRRGFIAAIGGLTYLEAIFEFVGSVAGGSLRCTAQNAEHSYYGS
jgi:hypothetical protein